MAKFLPGPFVGQISGRLGGQVFSHNKGGMYVRNGTIPTTSTTSFALAAKAIFTAQSQAWQTLAAGVRLAFGEWAADHPIADRLRQSLTMTGQQAYIKINSRLAHIGVAPLTAPPLVPSPAPLLTLVGSFDIGAGTFDLTYTATPLAATELLWIEAAVVDSAGINFVENKLRFLGTSAAAQASPFDPQTLIEARFGTLVVGQFVHIDAYVIDNATGLLSARRRVTGVVVTT